jgi:hypothetical protein
MESGGKASLPTLQKSSGAYHAEQFMGSEADTIEGVSEARTQDGEGKGQTGRNFSELPVATLATLAVFPVGVERE